MRRRGYSLIELMVVLSMFVMILMVSSQLMLRLWQTNAILREQRLAVQNLTRLTQQFRADAHGATTVVTGPTCEFVENDRRVIYSAANGGIERVERLGDKIVARNSYAMSRHMDVVFRQREVTGRVFAQLEIKPRTQIVHLPHSSEPLLVETLVALRQPGRGSLAESQP